VTIVAQQYDWVIGVDTHAKSNTYAACRTISGQVYPARAYANTPAGIDRAVKWIQSYSDKPILVAVEGASSYGAMLTRALNQAGITVCDVRPPKRAQRAQTGKTDQLDAQAAAKNILGVDITKLVIPRADGPRQALRLLNANRDLTNRQRTANINALTAMARTCDLQIDARNPLTSQQICQLADQKIDLTGPIHQVAAQQQAAYLAGLITQADDYLNTNRHQLEHLVTELAPGLLDISGCGPISAALILEAYSHHGRITSQEAFARLAGVSPLPACSGNTTRNRLNRQGDRQLNKALDTIAKSRLRYDPETIAYKDKRTKEGKTYREIKRLVKRYLARRIYRYLTTLDTLKP
jgi:transposase